MNFIKNFVQNSKAATAIEYGLIAALVAIAAIGGMRAIGDKVGTSYNNASDSFG